MTQNQTLLDYLKAHGSITRLEAANLGIMNLWQRIHEIEQTGVKIDRQDVTVPDRRGKVCHVTRYRLQSKAAAAQTRSEASGTAERLDTGQSVFAAAPNEQMVHGEYLKDGKRLTYSYIAVGYADKPAW